MKRLLIAALVPCILSTLHSEYPEPVLSIGSDRISEGVSYGPVYSVWDRGGKDHTGVIVGDQDFSLVVPLDHKETPVMQSGGLIIPLD
jgi:hypothetical protein